MINCGYYLQLSEVKKNIETVQGADVYPAAQQMLIHQGKVLKDGTTLEENKVAESSFIVIMLSKVKISFIYLFFFSYFEKETALISVLPKCIQLFGCVDSCLNLKTTCVLCIIMCLVHV